MPFATSSPFVMPAEDVDEDRAHVLVADDDLERARHHVGVRAAADVEEVRGRSTDLVHDVDGAHREPGAVRDHADESVEADVLKSALVRELLARVAHLRRVVLDVVGVTEHRVVVERDLRVERVHATVGCEDQWVDLDQVGVAFGVAAVELEQDLDRALGGLRVELRGFDPRRGTASSLRPSTGSMWMRAIASGFSSATCSISTPPCADSIPRCSLAARSRVNDA